MLDTCAHHRGFKHISSISRKRLVDGLCSNLSVLGLSIGALVSVTEPEDPAEHEASSASHRSALKAYTFFLSWLTSAAEEEDRASILQAGAGVIARRAHMLKMLEAQCMARPLCCLEFAA